MLILPLDLRLTETNFSSLQVQVNASVTFCYSVLLACRYGVVLESPVSSQNKKPVTTTNQISVYVRCRPTVPLHLHQPRS